MHTHSLTAHGTPHTNDYNWNKWTWTCTCTRSKSHMYSLVSPALQQRHLGQGLLVCLELLRFLLQQRLGGSHPQSEERQWEGRREKGRREKGENRTVKMERGVMRYMHMYMHIYVIHVHLWVGHYTCYTCTCTCTSSYSRASTAILRAHSYVSGCTLVPSSTSM